MTADPKIIGALASPGPTAVIELFELELYADIHGADNTLRFYAGEGAGNTVANGITWAGNLYTNLPIEAEGFEYLSDGELPRPKVRVANIAQLEEGPPEYPISEALLEINAFNPGNDLIGAKFTRIRTLARFLDAVNFDGGTNPYGTPDPTAEMPREIYYVDRLVTENKFLCEFELVTAFDLAGVRVPKRQCIPYCQWIYRSNECGYEGTDYFDASDESVSDAADDVCGKRLTSCVVRFGAGNVVRFGGFPGVGKFRA
jgi:lambda family phage minor tail protein L